MEIARLQEALPGVQDTVKEYRGKGLTEQDTKNAIIEPILGALGWPKHDLTRVRSEYRQTSKDNPVDYALFSGSRPVMFVEAKALDKDIDDYKFVVQILNYANAAGIDWAVITNGERWDLYKVLAKAEAAKKRFFSISVFDDRFATWMAWLTPNRLEGNDLEQFWRLVVAERAVRSAVNAMFAERDDELVKLLVKRTHLDVADVAQAIQLLRPTFEDADVRDVANLVGQPAAAPPPANTPTPAAHPSPMASGAQKAMAAVPTSGPNPAGKGSAAVTTATRASGGSGTPSLLVPKGTLLQPASPSSGKGLAPPEAGTKPVFIEIEGVRFEVASWRKLLLAAIQHIAKAQPERFSQVFSAEDFAGKKRRYFALTGEGMTTPIPVPGGFVEANQSAGAIIALVDRLLTFAGVDRSKVRYEVAAGDE